MVNGILSNQNYGEGSWKTMEISMIPMCEKSVDKRDLTHYVPNYYTVKKKTQAPRNPARENVSPFCSIFADHRFGCMARHSESEENYFIVRC